MPLTHRFQGGPLVNLRHRGEDVFRRVDLTGQRVAWQNPLAHAAVPAARQPDGHGAVTRHRLQPPLHPGPRQIEVSPAAGGADPVEDRRVQIVGAQRLRIPGRVGTEYVDHTYASDGSGERRQTPVLWSRLLFLPDVTEPWGIRRTTRNGMRFSTNASYDRELSTAPNQTSHRLRTDRGPLQYLDARSEMAKLELTRSA